MILLSFFIRNAFSVHLYVCLCLIEKKVFYATCELFEQIKKYFCKGLHSTLALLSPIFIPVSDISFLFLVYDMTQKYSWVSLEESFALLDDLLLKIFVIGELLKCISILQNYMLDDDMNKVLRHFFQGFYYTLSSLTCVFLTFHLMIDLCKWMQFPMYTKKVRCYSTTYNAKSNMLELQVSLNILSKAWTHKKFINSLQLPYRQKLQKRETMNFSMPYAICRVNTVIIVWPNFLQLQARKEDWTRFMHYAIREIE